MNAVIEQWGGRLADYFRSPDVVAEVAGVLVVTILATAFSMRTRGLFKAWREKKGVLAGMLAESGAKMVFAGLMVVLAWVLVGILTAQERSTVLANSFASLATAWAVIFLVTVGVRDRFLVNLLAWMAYLIAALSIFGILGETIAMLESLSLRLGTANITLLGLLKAGVLGVVLFWLAAAASALIDQKLMGVRDLTPSLQALIGKSAKVLFFIVAFLLAMGAVGVELTGLAIFGGAIGVGVGFGLQSIVSNLICGFILLIDRSIKPGDVIEIDQTYGTINKLGARYVSVLTRDGKEHLIPNENLIKNKVVNWSFSDQNVRVKALVAVSYRSNPHRAIELCIAAAQQTPRVLGTPTPKCLLKGFGDSSVELELRFWISDPHQGVRNITSEVLLRVWDLFAENGIEIPFPQRDIHLHQADSLRVALNPSST